VPFICSCDLDLDLMTLIHELDVDILKLYLLTKNEFSRSGLSEVRAPTGQTNTRTHTHTHTRTPNVYHAVFGGGIIQTLNESER